MTESTTALAPVATDTAPKPPTSTKPASTIPLKTPEKVEAAANEVMAVTQLYNVYSSCIRIVR